MATSSSLLAAFFVVVSLGGLLALSPAASARGSLAASALVTGSNPGLSSRADAYRAQVQALLGRYDATQSEGDRLLSERDADPRLVADQPWRQAFARVAQEHQIEYAEAQTFVAPPDAQNVQSCLTEGLRLTSTAEGMFADAFGADGHRAYYLSAHGNWDLNLGKKTIARCRTALAAWQASLTYS